MSVHLIFYLVIALFAVSNKYTAYGWHDTPHIAVMEATNVSYSSCLAIAPDILTTKLPSEAANHYSYIHCANITVENVLEQVKYYDKIDKCGHLYGAIVASTFCVRQKIIDNARPDYSYSFLAHYVGDLSQPLHNSPYDHFNKVNHDRIDGIVDNVQELTKKVSLFMVQIVLQSDDELLVAVANLANVARAADKRLRLQGTMTQKDALILLGQSASLLHAINKYIGAGVTEQYIARNNFQ